MDLINKLRIPAILFLVTFYFLSSPVSAAWDAGGRFNAENIDSILRRPNGTTARLILEARFKGRNNLNESVWAVKKIPISKSLVGTILKRTVKLGLSLPVQVAMMAAGWAYDELTGEMTKTTSETNPDQQPPTTTGNCYLDGTHTGSYGLMTYDECQAKPVVAGKTKSWFSYADGQFYDAAPSSPNPTSPNTVSTETADNFDYADILDTLSDSVVIQAFQNPSTQLPDSNIDINYNTFSDPTNNTDPFDAAARYLDQYYDASVDGDPLTDPDAIPDPIDNPGEEPTTIDDEAPVADAEPFDLCAEHPEILACQTLGESDDPIDIATEEIPFSYTPVSLSGSGYCPSPNVFVLSSGQSYSISNQPICDFASGINGVVIIICSMIGMYIVTGGIRNG